MKFTYRKSAVGAVLLCAAFAGGVAHAAELPDGTVLSKDNLDKVKGDTFEGHTIATLVTEKMEWQIRNTGLKLTLAHLPEPTLDPKYVEATKANAANVKFDSATREVSGHVAGMPFPDISESDSNAGDKVLWNVYYGSVFGKDVYNGVYFVTVNSSGYESQQKWLFQRLFNKGRFGEGKPILGDSDVLTKTIFVGVEPQDIKGTGTFTIRYDVPGRVEDQWAYIKSARRTRRLSGNAWMDPIGGFDLLQDDLYVYNARPSQYKRNKLVGKRWILASTNFKLVHNTSKSGSADEFPQLQKDAPYWNITDRYAPREVWVVEGTPPSEHPYSKKVVYVDTKVPVIYQGEVYDKKGEYWRQINFQFAMEKGQSTGDKYFVPMAGSFIDIKAKHATLEFEDPAITDKKGVTYEQFSVQALDTAQH
ncbi:DUF1329 domain-containing protein [Burkholderia cepacia]|uniref:DUF1329 domain-containing protein n=1 Tax=Burkholderia cepacia TaxID=292 RepID=UPI002AB61B9A|nr:DUF1329 domain-containing protein [Burkholderia cepacia]